MMIATPRLRLSCWKEEHREPFAAMHADPEVMHDYPEPFSREESHAKFERYRAAFEANGFSRMAVEHDGEFIGFVGVMLARPGVGAAEVAEIGWRFVRRAWGQGFATESARAALTAAFEVHRLGEVYAWTQAANARSQAVMSRLSMERRPDCDFLQEAYGRTYAQMVWIARRP